MGSWGSLSRQQLDAWGKHRLSIAQEQRRCTHLGVQPNLPVLQRLGPRQREQHREEDEAVGCP